MEEREHSVSDESGEPEQRGGKGRTSMAIV